MENIKEPSFIENLRSKKYVRSGNTFSNIPNCDVYRSTIAIERIEPKLKLLKNYLYIPICEVDKLLGYKLLTSINKKKHWEKFTSIFDYITNKKSEMLKPLVMYEDKFILKLSFQSKVVDYEKIYAPKHDYRTNIHSKYCSYQNFKKKEFLIWKGRKYLSDNSSLYRLDNTTPKLINTYHVIEERDDYAKINFTIKNIINMKLNGQNGAKTRKGTMTADLDLGEKLSSFKLYLSGDKYKTRFFPVIYKYDYNKNSPNYEYLSRSPCIKIVEDTSIGYICNFNLYGKINKKWVHIGLYNGSTNPFTEVSVDINLPNGICLQYIRIIPIEFKKIPALTLRIFSKKTNALVFNNDNLNNNEFINFNMIINKRQKYGTKGEEYNKIYRLRTRSFKSHKKRVIIDIINKDKYD